jgi:hypothetical protein
VEEGPWKMIGVNDYVRINMDNRNCIGIGRVSRIVNETIYVNMNNKYNLPVSFQIDKIVKHSKQLIDLIEVEDIVNKELVIGIIDITNDKEEIIGKKLITQYRSAQFTGLDIKHYIYANDIKTILTKEQFEANCYKVGGEE